MKIGLIEGTEEEFLKLIESMKRFSASMERAREIEARAEIFLFGKRITAETMERRQT